MKSINDRLNDLVVLRNVGGYPVVIITRDTPKGKVVEEDGSVLIPVSDIVSSLRNDKFVYGTDEFGTNATLYIEDAEIRELLKFDLYRIDKVKSKVKDGEDIDNKSLAKGQVVLSKEIFISKMNNKSESVVDAYINGLANITNGQKMMLSRIIRDEIVGKLGEVAASRIEKVKKIINE